MQISPDLSRFILTNVPSIPFLEAALLLRRDRTTSRSVEELARSLYVSTERASVLVDQLKSFGVIARADGDADRWRFAPRDATIDATYAELDCLYRHETVAVTQLVHDRTHRSAIRFANAFRLRREP
jgi:hypothetical protein